VDPGTTAAYAVLNINGGLVKRRSSKNIDLSTLVKELFYEGTVIVLGTDKRKCPAIIQKLAAQTGAKIINPRKDLLTKEKRELIKNFEVANEHEADALASARFAYKEIQPLLKKIDYFLKKKEKEELSSKVKKLVVTKEMSISSALKLLEPEKEEIKEKLGVEEKNSGKKITSC
jgi:predicted RNase H-like nuclease (RuvC/YqgF family)